MTIPSDRLGIGGWSYGGYMAGWAVTQTNRFKAAVAGAGVYNLVSDLGAETPSYIPGDEWQFGRLFDAQTNATLLAHSPITYVKNVKTPILLMHGELDPVDTIAQTYEFYRALKRFNPTPTEFVVYPGEGHALRDAKFMVDRMNRTLAWFDKYLKGDRQAGKTSSQ